MKTSKSRQEYLDKIDNKMFLSGMLDQEVSQSGNCQFSVILVNSFAQVKWMKGWFLYQSIRIDGLKIPELTVFKMDSQ